MVNIMQQQVITWVVLALYLIAMLVAGIIGAKKANTLTSFVVGGRKAGLGFGIRFRHGLFQRGAVHRIRGKIRV